jgi:hypothetical protein
VSEPFCTSKLESRAVTAAKTCASRPTKEFGLETASCRKYPPMSIRPFLGSRAEACAESGLAQSCGVFCTAQEGGHRTSVRELPAANSLARLRGGNSAKMVPVAVGHESAGLLEILVSKSGPVSSMLALRIVNYSSHGASGVAILKTFGYVR